MKHIKKFDTLNESALSDSKRQLKYFQDGLDLDVTIKELMDSIDATQLSLKSIYPTLTGKEKMSDLPQNEKFVESLNELELKLSEFQDTEEFESFARMPMRWYWIYTEDASELEIPVQILYRYYYAGEWSDIKLYMVNDEIEKFYDELTLVTIEIKVEKEDEEGNDNTRRWFYTTVDSGKNWKLQRDPKKINDGGESKIVKSNNPTTTFKDNMSWEQILHLAHNKYTKLIIY
jgi:hypothetical protein